MTITIEIITNQVGQNVYRIKHNGEWVGDYINGVNTQTSGIQEALNYAATIGDAVELGPGTFPVSATILLPHLYGLSLKGSGYQTTIEQAPGFANTIMAWADSTLPNPYYYFGHFRVYAPNGGPSNSWAMDLAQNETAANGLIEHIRIVHLNIGGLRLSGNENTLTINTFVGNRGTNAPGVIWDVHAGTAADIESGWTSGAIIVAQKFDFYGTIFEGDSVQMLQLYPAGQPSIYNFWGAYFNNNGTNYPMIYIQPYDSNILYLNFIGCMINPSALQLGNPFIDNPASSGSVTVYAKFINTVIQSSVAVNLFGATGGGTITGYAEFDDLTQPLTNVNVNNVAVSTPAVPASGTAQANGNPYPITVYLSGGSATQVQVTKYGTTYTIWSASTATAIPPLTIRLNPGDSITLTYSTAPAWTWVPA